jgi:predicted AlkP superfamily phosphohydrolase/phosphomutase
MPDTGHHLRLLDWERTCAYAPTATGYAIHIVRRGSDTPAGVADGDYRGFRDTLRRRLLDLVDPSTGEAVVTDVWTREEAFAGAYMDLAPDLALRLADGGLPSIAPSAELVLPRSEPMGTHSPEGIFAARGPGLRKGCRIEALSILDVAPLVMNLLGLRVPDDMEGRLPHEVFEDGPAPVDEAPNEEPRSPHPSDAPPLSSDDEDAVLRRLRGLGYLG